MPIKLKKCAGPCGQSKLHDEFWKDAKQVDGHMTRCIVCVKEDRRQRAERRRNGEEVPVVSEEVRQERSQRMIQLHAEGRAGGPAYGKLGGRPRKPRLAETLLEHFRERSDLVLRAVESNLRSKQKSQRMRAAEFLAGLEQDESKRLERARGSGKPPEEMTPEELEEFVAQGLAGMLERGEIDIDTITLPDSAVTEVEAA